MRLGLAVELPCKPDVLEDLRQILTRLDLLDLHRRLVPANRGDVHRRVVRPVLRRGEQALPQVRDGRERPHLLIDDFLILRISAEEQSVSPGHCLGGDLDVGWRDIPRVDPRPALATGHSVTQPFESILEHGVSSLYGLPCRVAAPTYAGPGAANTISRPAG